MQSNCVSCVVPLQMPLYAPLNTLLPFDMYTGQIPGVLDASSPRRHHVSGSMVTAPCSIHLLAAPLQQHLTICATQL